jgi:hypothetical protein
MRQTFVVGNHPQSRGRALEAVRTAPHGYVVTVGEPTRTLEQNAAQWPILDAFAKQKQLCVNGRMEYVSDEEWKDVLTGAFRDEMARVANFRGRMILLGQRTSKFGKGEFSDWLEWLHAAAIEEGVVVYPEDERRAA